MATVEPAWQRPPLDAGADAEPRRLSKRGYEKELERLQVELARLQEWIVHEGLKVVVLFEGRDTAGKGGTIKRITEKTNPRVVRTVALGTPTERERTQWYFQRYVAHLPAAGEMVLFDRSWYNRAGVEHVMGFCTQDEYEEFMRTCPQFERDLLRSGIILVKYWLSVSDEEQERRFKARLNDPAKQWKLSGMDLEARRRWVDYAEAKDDMFAYTDTRESPWYVVEADDKRTMRLNLISHLLSLIPYEDVRAREDQAPAAAEAGATSARRSATRTTCPARYVVGSRDVALREELVGAGAATIGPPVRAPPPSARWFPTPGRGGPRWRHAVAGVASIVSTSKEDPMFTRIVVGVDCREGGRDALALAALLQSAGGGELVAVHACAPAPLLHEDVLARVEAELARAGATGRAARRHRPLARSRPAHDRGTRGPSSSSSDPPAAPAPTASWPATTRRRRCTARPCAVAVAPRGFAGSPHALRRIGVGFDGSRSHASRWRSRCRLAHSAGAALRAITVVPATVPLWPAVAWNTAWAGDGPVPRTPTTGCSPRISAELDDDVDARGRWSARRGRSSPRAARTSTCSWWAPERTGRCAGCCSAARRPSSPATRRVLCS